MKLSHKFLLPAVAALALMPFAAPAQAAIEPRAILKTFFETGNVPTEQQFYNLIDSFINYNDDGLTITGVVSSGGSTTPVARNVPIREFVTLLSLFTVPGPGGSNVPVMAPEFAGQSGFLGLRLSNGPDTFLGYFQLRMDPDTGPTTTGIHVDYFVFDSTPNQAIEVNAVPEPASLALLGLGAIGLLRRRR